MDGLIFQNPANSQSVSDHKHETENSWNLLQKKRVGQMESRGLWVMIEGAWVCTLSLINLLWVCFLAIGSAQGFHGDLSLQRAPWRPEHEHCSLERDKASILLLVWMINVFTVSESTPNAQTSLCVPVQWQGGCKGWCTAMCALESIKWYLKWC